jgi:hypothetical protein
VNTVLNVRHLLDSAEPASGTVKVFGCPAKLVSAKSGLWRWTSTFVIIFGRLGFEATCPDAAALSRQMKIENNFIMPSIYQHRDLIIIVSQRRLTSPG